MSRFSTKFKYNDAYESHFLYVSSLKTLKSAGLKELNRKMGTNSSNKVTTNSPLPAHPFFSQSSNPATLTDCLDAIDRANAVIELINSLELGEQDGGLSERAMFGYYWVNSLVQSALTFVNVRLNELQLESNQQLQSRSLVTGLFQALVSMDEPHQDQFLKPVAHHMGMEVSELFDTLKDMSSN